MSCFGRIFEWGSTSKQQKEPQNEDIPAIKNVKLYNYKELRIATDNFSSSNKVGEGGFGSVYKGMLKDGKVVAIKVLSSESRQGSREFMTELEAISGIAHENLVKLHGFCIEETHRILVYDYLENNSLAKTLLGSSRSNIQFSWRTRVRICIGVARGLAFLHEEVKPRIVHRDIKASNILLDKDLKPKIADFGLAKLMPPNATHVSTRVAGTIGYLAPEYAIRGQVTRKSDVYSYGVLLLEIISGRCNTDTRLAYDDQLLLEKTWNLYECGELEKIIDRSLADNLNVEEALRFLKVGLLCTQEAMKLRPSMSTVVRMLTGDEVVDSQITRPGLINDYMALKVRNQKTAEGLSPALSSDMDRSHDITHGSMSYTEIYDRD